MKKYLLILLFINFSFSEEVNYSNQISLLYEKLSLYKQFNNQEDIKIPYNLNLSINQKNKNVLLIKRKLFLSGEYVYSKDDYNDIYDENTIIALSRFQANNQIKETGILDKETVDKLNKPIKKIINDLNKNIIRLKNINFDSTSVIINIPEYKLSFFYNGNLIYSMNVIVASYNNQSCLLNSKIDSLIINPSWYVPNSIAQNEMIRKLNNNPDYFVKNGFNIYSDGKLIEPENYDAIENTDNLKFVQKPQEKNALGKIKFVFKNNCGIYLHDTNQRELFVKSKNKSLSHGCIRLSKPFDLANILLRINNINPSIINTYLESNKTKKIDLNNPIPIYIIYQNIIINKENEIVYLNDIYRKN